MSRLLLIPSLPRTPRAAVLASVALGIVLALQAFPVGAAAREGARSECPAPTGRIKAITLPASIDGAKCGLIGRTVVKGALALEVPPPGHAISAAGLGVEGETELAISTSRQGIVSIDDSTGSETSSFTQGTNSAAPCDELGIAGCLDPCVDTNYHVNDRGSRVKTSQPWFFKSASTPTGGTSALTVDKALAHIKAGSQAIVKGSNDCGLTDPVAQTSPYMGRTKKSTGIKLLSSSISCAFDGKNVVEFGALPPGYLGLACTRASTTGGPWYIDEADIRLQKGATWTTSPDVTACFNRYDLQGVMAHERGHAFGLAHTDGEVTHIPQTMYPSSGPCSSYARTLGSGDHAGLSALY